MVSRFRHQTGRYGMSRSAGVVGFLYFTPPMAA